MSHEPRIPSDPEYVRAVGQAHYNFTYLEWGVVWTIAKLSADGFGSVPSGEPAGRIARALILSIDSTTPPLPRALRARLVKVHERFLGAIRVRNKLLHAHPYTADGGAQRLGSPGLQWPRERVDEAAVLFEDLAVEVLDVFHGDLASARP